MSAAPQKYVVWKRQKDKLRDPWQQVVTSESKAELFRVIGELELRSSFEEWEFLVLPEGQTPATGPEWAARKIQKTGDWT